MNHKPQNYAAPVAREIVSFIIAIGAIGYAGYVYVVPFFREAFKVPPPLTCKQTFDIAITGAYSSATSENKGICAREYAQFLAATPPSDYQIVGASVRVGNTALSLAGLSVERTVTYLNEITPEPQPAVYLRLGRTTRLLEFRTKEQADEAFSKISTAIANNTGRKD